MPLAPDSNPKLSSLIIRFSDGQELTFPKATEGTMSMDPNPIDMNLGLGQPGSYVRSKGLVRVNIEFIALPDAEGFIMHANDRSK